LNVVRYYFRILTVKENMEVDRAGDQYTQIRMALAKNHWEPGSVYYLFSKCCTYHIFHEDVE